MRKGDPACPDCHGEGVIWGRYGAAAPLVSRPCGCGPDEEEVLLKISVSTYDFDMEPKLFYKFNPIIAQPQWTLTVKGSHITLDEEAFQYLISERNRLLKTGPETT